MEKEKEMKTTPTAGSTKKAFSSTGVQEPSYTYLYKGKGLEKHPLLDRVYLARVVLNSDGSSF
jgi:hypothetical protein